MIEPHVLLVTISSGRPQFIVVYLLELRGQDPIFIHCLIVHLSKFLPYAASGPGRCKISNGGCWHENKNGITFSACVVGSLRSYFIISKIKYFGQVKTFVVFSFNRIVRMGNAHAPQDLKVMVSKAVKVRDLDLFMLDSQWDFNQY